jgi:small subunit ribosomal protein S9
LETSTETRFVKEAATATKVVKDAAGYIWTVGRRKSSVARVRLRPGTGTIVINDREVAEYFPDPQYVKMVMGPLQALEREKLYDVVVNVRGGGLTGQSGATAMGIARAIVHLDPDSYVALREHGFITRDSRVKERKKYGLRKARKRPQYSKR